jgi:solute:Na+ symporter, SSS family
VTAPFMTVSGLFFAYAIYIATVCARSGARPDDFLDAALEIPSWGYIFAGAGVVLAGLGLPDHILLISLYGLQYSHVAVGLVLIALCGALVQKRVWLASRITGLRTIGDLTGEYFGSVTLRIYLLVVLFLFSVPFAAYCLSEIGGLAEAATGGALPASFVIWATAFFLFLYSAIGGWRAVIYVVGAQAFLVLTLVIFTGGFAGATFDSLALVTKGIVASAGVLPDQIPGVIQFTNGIGKQLPAGGIWTTVAILSFALAMIGLVLSPGFAFLGISTSTKKGFAFEQVWMTGGLTAGALLLILPIVGAEIAASSGTGLAGPQAALSGFVARLGSVDQLMGVCFLMLLVTSLQIGIAFFAGSGASIVTIELIGRYVLPDLDGRGRKLAARIALAAIFFAVGLMASFAPLSASIFSSLALSLSAQLLPAFLGLCWLPWMSRSAVLAGLVLGIIIVVFTEPLGLILFEGLFVDLPWGRWPLTVHSAGWGLFFNVAACLLVSLFTRSGEEREHRQRLHDEFKASHRVEFGGRATRTAKWSLTLIWAFLALGPGAILGNTFFSHPIFTGGDVTLGLPSLLVWQILFWLIGVLIVWWLAYHDRMSIIEAVPRRTLRLKPPTSTLQQLRTPGWIARMLGRLVER